VKKLRDMRKRKESESTDSRNGGCWKRAMKTLDMSAKRTDRKFVQTARGQGYFGSRAEWRGVLAGRSTWPKSNKKGIAGICKEESLSIEKFDRLPTIRKITVVTRSLRKGVSGGKIVRGLTRVIRPRPNKQKSDLARVRKKREG